MSPSVLRRDQDENPKQLELHNNRSPSRYQSIHCSLLNSSTTRLEPLQVSALQTELRRWRDASNTLFQYSNEEPIIPSAPSSSWASLKELTIPPCAQCFPSIEAAVMVTLFHGAYNVAAQHNNEYYQSSMRDNIIPVCVSKSSHSGRSAV